MWLGGPVEWVEAFEEAAQILAREFVFPHTYYRPAFGAEAAVDLPVAGLVAGDLGSPEGRAMLGPGGVGGAAVPDSSAVGLAEAEAAVHKHRGLQLRKYKVRFHSSGGSTFRP